MNTDAEIAIKLNVPDFLFQSILERPQLLFELLAIGSLDELKGFLFDQLKDKDGSPSFDDFQVHLFTYDPATGKGSFRLKFAINRLFCCSDTTGCSNDYLDFEFDYSLAFIKATARYFNWSIDN